MTDMADLFLSAKERTITVKGKISEFDTYIDGKGYIDENGVVWIYCAAGKPFTSANEYPYFWLDETSGDKVFSNPSESILEEFKDSKLFDLSTVQIVNNTNEGEELYNEQAINDMNSAAAVYVPTIDESDDFLKKIIKRAILEKGIDINRLKYRMNTKYGLPNMKTSLQNKTKMSTVYFMQWAELLGIDFTIAIEDNGTDTIDPLKKPLFYVSSKDQVLREDEM